MLIKRNGAFGEPSSEDLLAIRKALIPFAKMHRENSDPEEVACTRGAASDMSIITSGDFEQAAAVLSFLICDECEIETLEFDIAETTDFPHHVIIQRCTVCGYEHGSESHAIIPQPKAV